MLTKLIAAIKFKAAKCIAKIAECLDYKKNSHLFSQPVRAKIGHFVERMHDTAQQLAGPRAYEIYGADESIYSSIEEICKFFDLSQPKISLVQAAGMTCANAE